MAIALDGEYDDGAMSSNVTSISWAHTVTSNTNGILVVISGASDTTAADRPITGVTFDGNGTGFGASKVQNNTTNNHTVEIWTQLNPAVASAKTVAVSFTGTITVCGGGSQSYTGVSAVGATTGANKPNNSGTSFTDAINTTQANSWLVDGYIGSQTNGAAGIVNGSNTARFALAGNIEAGGSDLAATTIGSYSLGWQQGVAGDWASGVSDFTHAIIEIKEYVSASSIPGNSKQFLMLLGLGT